MSSVVVTIGGCVFRKKKKKKDKAGYRYTLPQGRCVTPFKPKIVVVCFVVYLIPDTVKHEDVFILFVAPIRSSP